MLLKTFVCCIHKSLLILYLSSGLLLVFRLVVEETGITMIIGYVGNYICFNLQFWDISDLENLLARLEIDRPVVCR